MRVMLWNWQRCAVKWQRCDMEWQLCHAMERHVFNYIAKRNLARNPIFESAAMFGAILAALGL